jgi:hypothetical protein
MDKNIMGVVLLKDTTKAWQAGLRAEAAKYEPVIEPVVVEEKPKFGIGQCYKCGHGSFESRIDKRIIYRTCKNKKCRAPQPPIE